MEDQVFMSNLKGGVVANLVTGFMFIVFWIIKNKCKHCTCKSHTCCFECTSKEDGFDLEEGPNRRVERQDTRKIRGQTKISLHKLHKSEHARVLSQHTKAVPSD